MWYFFDMYWYGYGVLEILFVIKYRNFKVYSWDIKMFVINL